jgi:hypothetical protein
MRYEPHYDPHHERKQKEIKILRGYSEISTRYKEARQVIKALVTDHLGEPEANATNDKTLKKAWEIINDE